MRLRGSTRWGVAPLLLALVLAPASIGAQGEGEETRKPAQDAAPPPVSLDTLLKLPAATAAPRPTPEKGGATRKEWENRFAKARSEVAAARGRLEKSQAELEELAAGVESWQVSAPGGLPGGEQGPLSFAKREEIRRGREDVAAAEKALDELRIQASLAGVPPEWTGAPETPTPSAP